MEGVDRVGIGQPLAIGCMRLSTERARDEARGLATIHAALDAGVTLLDTADAYCLDAEETGHNERLIARALANWSGDASRVRVATKGGLTRPGGRWENDGRARHLASACHASLRALGREHLDLYQLHAPDPRVALGTSVRALDALRREGLVDAIGLGNVSLDQLQEALRIAPIAAVQVELGPWQQDAIRGGWPSSARRRGSSCWPTVRSAARPARAASRRMWCCASSPTGTASRPRRWSWPGCVTSPP